MHFIFEFKKTLNFQFSLFSIEKFNLNQIFDLNYVNSLIFKYVYLSLFILKSTIKRNALMLF